MPRSRNSVAIAPEIELAARPAARRFFVTGLVVCADRLRSGIAAAARKRRSTGSSRSFSIGSSVTTQVCPTRALYLAGDVHAARPGVRDQRPPRGAAVRAGSRAQRAAARTSARRLNFNMETGFRDIVHGHRHAPGVLGFFHKYQSSVTGSLSSTRTVAAGPAGASLPARSSCGWLRPNSRTASRI